MAKLNKLFLIGNLTRDPDLKYTPSGGAVVSFSIAMNRTWNGPDGEKKEEVCYVEIVMFGKRAEVIDKYFSKGNPIFIEGRLKFEQWDDNSNQKRNTLKVVAEDFQFIGSKMGTQESSGEKPSAPADNKPYTNVKDGDDDIDESLIPF